MLSAVPKKWFSWDFALKDPEGRHVGDVGLSAWRERGQVVLGTSEYQIRSDGMFARFVLEENGSVRARARQTSTFGCEFEIEFEGDHYSLKKRSMWRSAVVLRQGGEELGTILPIAWYKSGARIELADRLPPVVKLFAIWLALLLWKRDADAG